MFEFLYSTCKVGNGYDSLVAFQRYKADRIFKSVGSTRRLGLRCVQGVDLIFDQIVRWIVFVKLRCCISFRWRSQEDSLEKNKAIVVLDKLT